MTVLDHIPGLRGTGAHRGKSGLELQRDLADAETQVARLTAGIDQISAERNTAERRADQAAIDLGIARKEIRQLEATIRLRDEQIADLQRKVDVGVKAEHIIAQTQELPAVPEAPFATPAPARLPAWAERD
ncbi:hypothetical protein [Streptomyces sp. MN13]